MLRMIAFSLVVCAGFAGCGGGGGGGGSQNSSPTASGTPVPNPAPPSSSPASPTQASLPVTPQSSTPNVQPVIVSSTPTATRNMLMTSVTVCVPGTTNCATLDNIQVDTGSQGLRILSSALPANLALPAISSSATMTGECAVFGSGYAWGSVRAADVHMAGETASALPVQLIAAPAVPATPADCAGSGLPMMNSTNLRANGILGIGIFAADCGAGCVNSALPRWYYTCQSAGACTATTQPLADQVTNPVSAFSTDNNGVVIDLPAVADAGSPSVSGSLIFGIGTQANNVLGNTIVLNANTQSGYVTTTYAGNTWSASFFDSGSNGLFFPSTTLVTCGVWYCPPAPQTGTATIASVAGKTTTLSFEVASQQTLLSSGNNAFSNLGGKAANVFDWGLPFFFGRRLYASIEGRVTPAGTGPYYAF